MGFYIRKSFRAGPLRLNLSKRGLGASIGVKGLRVGSGPRGSYVHAGRKGLYYRKNLGGGKSKSTATSGSLKPLGVVVLAVMLVYVIRWFIKNPAIFFSLGAIVLLLLGVKLYNTYKRESHLKKFKRLLDSCFILNSEPINQGKVEEIIRVKKRLQKYPQTASRVGEIEKKVYEALLDKILDDKTITPDEKEAIEKLESVITIDEDYKTETKKEIFRLYYLDAIADRAITTEEMNVLKNIVIGLNLKKEDIKEELATLREIVRMQKLAPPLKPVENVAVKLQKSETPFYSSSAKVLSRRKAGRGSPSEYEYSIKREGQFIVTDKRILVVGDGTTSIKLSDIVDLDVDLDNKMIIISKGSSSIPTFIQSQEPLYAGKIIDLLTTENAP
ncbi:MAG: DUF4236 domain-containing protein [Deltaproteobacteria bacterium]|nr:DUF4236 domain-containing protein [Deltaproteobacteria bacterium]